MNEIRSYLAKLQKNVTKIDFTKTGSLTSSSPLKTVEEQIIGEDIYKHEVCDINHQLFEYNEIFYAFKSLMHLLILPVFDEHGTFQINLQILRHWKDG